MHDGSDETLTLAGTRIAPVPVEIATAFLDRLGERPPEEIWVALGARRDTDPLIGVAVLGASSADDGRVMIAVEPASRRLHVGRDLLRSLVSEAAGRGLRQLRICYPVDAVLADAFIDTCGLRHARQIVGGSVSAVLFLGE